MKTSDPAKRIPKSLGTDAKLFGTYTLADLAVALFPGVVVVLFTQVALPPSATVAGVSVGTVTLPFAVVAIAVGGLFVSLTPTYTTSIDWLETVAGFHRASSRLNHEEATAYTQVERIRPAYDAVERTDGALVGIVQVDPPAMALATDAEWERKADGFREFLNTSVEFPIQLYSTTRPFPVEEHLAGYQERLDDPDVKANPRLAALIEQYVEWYVDDLEQRRMTIRDHYVVVPVTPREVQFERESPLERLADVPVVGLFVQVWLAPSDESQRVGMAEALDDRLRRVEAGLRGIEGCSARRVDAVEAAQLVGEYWSGEGYDTEEMRRAIRTRQLVGGVR